MGISTSTGTLIAGQSRTFNLSPASAVTLTLSPNVRVTITETPATVAATGLGGNASRVHEPRLPGVVTYGPYPMGGAVVVEVASNSGSTVTWVRSDSIIAESADGAQSLVSGDGNIAAEQIRITAGSDSVPMDIFDMYSTGLPRKLTLPSPYSAVGPAMVHPSVVYVPASWRGWRYWMAITPYPNNDAQYENPSILVSNDGESWEVPAGLTNPLVGKPVGGYNADVELVLSPDLGKLYLIYRERIDGVGNYVKCMESGNGVTWSAPVTIITGTYGSQDYASPSLWWDATSAVWRMISHNLDGGSTYPMQTLSTSGSSIYSGWSAPSAITIANPTGGRTWWHSTLRRLADGRIVGLVQDIVNGGAGATGALFVAESLDGTNFAVQQVYADLTYYRPAFVVRETPTGAGVTAFIGRAGAGSIQSVWREDWLQGAAQLRRNEAGASYALSGAMPANVLWFDNFNRTDGAVGSPIVGSAFTVDSGTVTIVSNRLSTGSAGNNRALVSVGRADYSVEVKFAAAPSAIWLIVRAVDTSNFWRVGLGSALPNTLYRERIAAGASASLTAITGPVLSSTINAGDVVRVACRGRRMRVYVNGMLWSEWTDPALFATGVKIGVQGTNASTLFDDLLCLA